MIKNRKPIRLRPEIVLTNEEFGHFEVDLIVGTEHKGAILTIVEMNVPLLLTGLKTAK
ncbi:hypothetical protein [Capnocytophaga canimorsus]|uniref:hypothetical protein n=1 Tax=Capnocytophaga canimorsus TaxID=28188 RepID=UPI00385D6FC5